MAITAQELMANKLFNPAGPYDVEKILCRKQVPPDMTCQIADKSWQGYKVVMKQGKPVKVLDPKYVLIIEPNGLCEIHKTELNLKRLRMFAERAKIIKREERKFTNVLGEEEIEIVESQDVAPYEMLEENMLQQGLVRQLAEQVRAQLAEPKEDFGEEEVTAVQPDEELPAPGQTRNRVLKNGRAPEAAGPIKNDGKSKRMGRTPKNPVPETTTV